MGFMLGIIPKYVSLPQMLLPNSNSPVPESKSLPHPLAISQGVDFDLATLNSTEDTLVVVEKA